MSKSPASNFDLDVRHRMDGITTNTVLFKALRNAAPGNKRGNVSKVWKLDGHTRFEAASMAIFEHKSAKEIHELLSDSMDDVTDRVLSTWIKSIRKAYAAAHDEQLASIATAEQFAFASGDLVALIGITFGSIAPQYMGWANSTSIQDMGTKDRHVMLRFLEVITSAAKVQSEARRSEAQTQTIMSKLQDNAKLMNDDGASDKTRSDSVKQVTALINELTGIRSGGAA